MTGKTLICLFSFLLTLIVAGPGLCLESQDVVRLKKAGISDRTILLMVNEKVIETCAFTVEEILELKNAGLSEETIQVLIREGSFMKDTGPIIYGRDIRSIKFTTANDIIRLKDAGISDEIIRAIVIFGSRDPGDVEREKAWDMLKNMGIVVDMREGSD